jgi:hypothetical protein
MVTTINLHGDCHEKTVQCHQSLWWLPSNVMVATTKKVKQTNYIHGGHR